MPLSTVIVLYLLCYYLVTYFVQQISQVFASELQTNVWQRLLIRKQISMYSEPLSQHFVQDLADLLSNCLIKIMYRKFFAAARFFLLVFVIVKMVENINMVA